MKNLAALFILALTLAGCKSEIDYAEVTAKNDLIYKYGDTDPFSGIVLNTPIGFPGVSALCNSQIEKGRYSGKSECFYNSQKVYEVEYLAGKKDGIEEVFDVKTGKTKSVKNWRNGRQHGVMEEYVNGNLVLRNEYKDGKRNGEESRWEDDGKTIVTELTWRDGKEHTGYKTYSEGKASYLNGQLHGPQVKYGYITGTVKSYVSAEENYDNGQLNDIQKKFVNAGHTGIVQQEAEITYDSGVAVSGWLRKFNSRDGSGLPQCPIWASLRETQGG